MGRGRPRIYKTPEDKAAANRAKSMRSYYKKRAAMSSKHGTRHHADNSKSTVLSGASKDSSIMARTDPTDIPGWVALVRSTDDDFRLLTGDSTRRLLEFLYKQYTKNNHVDTFKETTIEVQALSNTIQRCEDALLQLGGVGKEFRAAEMVGKAIREAQHCLEEVECYASIGKAEIREAHEAADLMFQSLLY